MCMCTCGVVRAYEATITYCLRSAVGCKPREAVLYPDTVAGANPKVGPYCSSRWLLEGLWLMQRSESGDSRGSATAPLHAQPQTEGRPDRGTFRCVRYGSARFEGGSVSGVNPKGPLSRTPPLLACSLKPLRAGERGSLDYIALARRSPGPLPPV